MARTYTVLIEACDEEGRIWQALHPAEYVTIPGRNPYQPDAAALARDTAAHQNIAEGDNWRVRVWHGDEADTATEPAAEVYGAEVSTELEPDLPDPAPFPLGVARITNDGGTWPLIGEVKRLPNGDTNLQIGRPARGGEVPAGQADAGVQWYQTGRIVLTPAEREALISALEATR